MTQLITDLYGNAPFTLRVRQAILAAQHDIKQVAVLMIDCYGSEKPLTDSNPSAAEFSNQMWMRLKSALRDSDTVERMDGGTMAVLLTSVNGSKDALLVAKKLLRSLKEPINLDDQRVNVKPRIGIALFPEHCNNASLLVERAGLALAEANRTDNDYILYSPDEPDGGHAMLRMGQLRQAIVGDQLFLLYQPKIDLKSGSVSGVEVLTRWQHPELGLISPDEFIPLAERTGLIIPLTLWLLQRALLQCRSWYELGFDVNVAVNLSMWNLDAPELPGQIQSLLNNIGVPPDRLELEITESAIMGDAEHSMRSMALLRDLGVQFTIDDFGTGYSSLAYLKKLPVAAVKIDKSFVQNMEFDRDNATIIRSIIDLGHNLGLKVIAEGIETAAAAEVLKRLNCDEAQGYYYSRPIPAPDVTQFISHSGQTLAKLGTPGNGVAKSVTKD